jgi:hypothetical protein
MPILVLISCLPVVAGVKPRFWRDFQVGDCVDVKDVYSKWYEGGEKPSINQPAR